MAALCEDDMYGLAISRKSATVHPEAGTIVCRAGVSQLNRQETPTEADVAVSNMPVGRDDLVDALNWIQERYDDLEQRHHGLHIECSNMEVQIARLSKQVAGLSKRSRGRSPACEEATSPNANSRGHETTYAILNLPVDPERFESELRRLRLDIKEQTNTISNMHSEKQGLITALNLYQQRYDVLDQRHQALQIERRNMELQIASLSNQSCGSTLESAVSQSPRELRSPRELSTPPEKAETDGGSGTWTFDMEQSAQGHDQDQEKCENVLDPNLKDKSNNSPVAYAHVQVTCKSSRRACIEIDSLTKSRAGQLDFGLNSLVAPRADEQASPFAGTAKTCMSEASTFEPLDTLSSQDTAAGTCFRSCTNGFHPSPGAQMAAFNELKAFGSGAAIVGRLQGHAPLLPPPTPVREEI